MAIELVRAYFEKVGIDERVIETDSSSATVELAAQALNVIPARIAKTLSFKNEQGCFLVVVAGDAKVDNTKFKNTFAIKAKMLAADEVEPLVGHEIGGVCPFGIKDNVPVYLDKSLQRFDTVFPACGSSNSMIELTIEELFEYSNAVSWVDACKGWE